MLLTGPGCPVEGNIPGQFGLECLYAFLARVSVLAGVTRQEFGAGDLLASGHKLGP